MGNSEIPKICKAAIRAGVNFIDTSPWYGNSEANIGKALKEERVPRQAYYIATKVATETRGRQHGSKRLQVLKPNQLRENILTRNFREETSVN